MAALQFRFIMDNVYHKGEQAIQQMVGEEITANANGRVIVDSIIKGAINFITKQPMAIVSSVDDEHNVWVSMLVGEYGFVKASSTNRLSFNTDFLLSDPKDIFFNNIVKNGHVGTLFIELETRRRYRINGEVDMGQNYFDLNVKEAYPNCPKYIQQRSFSFSVNRSKALPLKEEGNALNKKLKEWIQTSDTLFVGSQGTDGKMDASHRGGNSGFVQILDDITLKIPDYQGNSMYNTLGNFYQNPRAGLLFIDFAKQAVLQLSGNATLNFEQKNQENLAKTTGTGRYWLFEVNKWIETNSHNPLTWEFSSYSPFNP